MLMSILWQEPYEVDTLPVKVRARTIAHAWEHGSPDEKHIMLAFLEGETDSVRMLIEDLHLPDIGQLTTDIQQHMSPGPGVPPAPAMEEIGFPQPLPWSIGREIMIRGRQAALRRTIQEMFDIDMAVGAAWCNERYGDGSFAAMSLTSDALRAIPVQHALTVHERPDGMTLTPRDGAAVQRVLGAAWSICSKRPIESLTIVSETSSHRFVQDPSEGQRDFLKRSLQAWDERRPIASIAIQERPFDIRAFDANVHLAVRNAHKEARQQQHETILPEHLLSSLVRHFPTPTQLHLEEHRIDAGRVQEHLAKRLREEPDPHAPTCQAILTAARAKSMARNGETNIHHVLDALLQENWAWECVVDIDSMRPNTAA